MIGICRASSSHLQRFTQANLLHLSRRLKASKTEDQQFKYVKVKLKDGDETQAT